MMFLNLSKLLSTKEFTAEEREVIESRFGTLYQSNNDLEEFCIRHQVNPINVWYWFKQSKVIPKQTYANVGHGIFSGFGP